MRLEASEKLAEATKALEAARSTLDELQALKTAQKGATESKLERALKFMEGIKYKDGSTALKRFETKEIMSGHGSASTSASRANLNARMTRLQDGINRQTQALQGSKGDSYSR